MHTQHCNSAVDDFHTVVCHDVGDVLENLKALMPEEEKRALLVFEISLPMEIDRNALRRTLKDKARTLGLQLSMQHRDIFEALHRVQPV